MFEYFFRPKSYTNDNYGFTRCNGVARRYLTAEEPMFEVILFLTFGHTRTPLQQFLLKTLANNILFVRQEFSMLYIFVYYTIDANAPLAAVARDAH